jgi:hypothetical protein
MAPDTSICCSLQGTRVEAEKAVPRKWAPGAEGASGATGYRIQVAGFVWGKAQPLARGKEEGLDVSPRPK